MIKSFSPLLTTLMLVGISFMAAIMPTWMVYMLCAGLLLVWAINWAFHYSHLMAKMWLFCTEFLGFCLLVTLFVGTMVLMNGLITA